MPEVHEQPAEEPAPVEPGAGWRRFWPEWVFLFVAVLLFCSRFLDLQAETRLPGNVSESYQSLDWTLVNSLRNYGQFPLWNPYLRTGQPYVADPMTHVFNPVVTLPVLLFGVRAGFKLGVFLSFVIAAFGMWRLAQILGLGRAARLWTALMYTFAGQPAAKFLSGDYLFILAFAWIPWVLSSLFLIYKTGQRRHVALAALFMAVFFFSGNLYYQYFMIWVSLFFILVMLLRFHPRFPWITLESRIGGSYLLMALLALGMMAIQLLPLAEFSPRLSKDMALVGSHTPIQIFLDYTSKDPRRPDVYSQFPASEEIYAYIGLAPFIGALLLPLAFMKRTRRPLIFFLLLVLFTVIWVDLDNMPWRNIFSQTYFLLLFRQLLRVLIYGSLGLIVLAGFGFDTLWQILSKLAARYQRTPAGQAEKQAGRAALFANLSKAGLFVLAAGMALSAIDVYATNHQYVKTQEIFQPAYAVMGWLRDYDRSNYLVRNNPNTGWLDAVISHNMRYADVWYHNNDVRLLEGQINRRYLIAEPHYITQSPEEPLPDLPGVTWVAQIEDTDILRLTQSLPMAFAVTDELMAGDGEWIKADDVISLESFFPGPNDVEVIANGGSQSSGYKLVVLTTHFPGWQLKVDGKRQEIFNVGGYLASELLPGVHRYQFSYRPRSFFAGLLVSLIALAFTLYWLVSDLHLSRQWLRQRWQQAGEAGQRLRGLPGRWLGEPERVLEAVLRQGALHLDQPLDLPDETRLRLTVEPQVDLAHPLRNAAQRWAWASGTLGKVLLHSVSFEMWLFSAAILVYLATRLVGLLDYPIYFFTDEAVQTLLAQDLVRDGFTSPDGEFLPTYFRNVDHFNLSTSVYLQVIPYLLFGKSAYITRLASVLMTLLAAVCVGLILRDIFKQAYWWTATLILSTAPAWFLHSRTAFEVVLMVSFYAAALYYYLLYRYRSPRYLYAALVLFSLAFYSYSPGQVVVVATSLGLLLSDIRYHWSNRAVGWRGLGLLLLLIIPYVRFRLGHPTAVADHLITLNSYWVQSIPLSDKLSKFWTEYRNGLSPLYWYFSTGNDLVRHLMKNYGNLLRATLPFTFLGLLICLKEIRSPAHRLLLITLLAAPTGAAMAQLAVTRALMMVIPASLLAALGLVTALRWLENLRLSPRLLALGAFSVLSIVNIWMLRDALVNGPTWYQEYGLMGMQYGARQLFTDVQDYAREHPGAKVVVSPVWANGPDLLARFFLPEGSPITLGNIDAYMYEYRPLDEQTVFVMTPEEYQRVIQSGKFVDFQVDNILPYPNGKPGFYFVRLRYVENIQDILAAERIERRTLAENEISVDGELVRVRHSRLDMGNIGEILDGNRHSLVRTFEANPFILELTFSQPRQISGFTLFVGDTELKVRVLLYTSAAPEPVEFDFSIDASPLNPQGTVDFGQAYTVSVLYLEIKDMRQDEPGHVHLWELIFR